MFTYCQKVKSLPRRPDAVFLFLFFYLFFFFFVLFFVSQTLMKAKTNQKRKKKKENGIMDKGRMEEDSYNVFNWLSLLSPQFPIYSIHTLYPANLSQVIQVFLLFLFLFVFCVGFFFGFFFSNILLPMTQNVNVRLFCCHGSNLLLSYKCRNLNRIASRQKWFYTL